MRNLLVVLVVLVAILTQSCKTEEEQRFLDSEIMIDFTKTEIDTVNMANNYLFDEMIEYAKKQNYNDDKKRFIVLELEFAIKNYAERYESFKVFSSKQLDFPFNFEEGELEVKGTKYWYFDSSENAEMVLNRLIENINHPI